MFQLILSSDRRNYDPCCFSGGTKLSKRNCVEGEFIQRVSDDLCSRRTPSYYGMLNLSTFLLTISSIAHSLVCGAFESFEKALFYLDVIAKA